MGTTTASPCGLTAGVMLSSPARARPDRTAPRSAKRARVVTTTLSTLFGLSATALPRIWGAGGRGFAASSVAHLAASSSTASAAARRPSRPPGGRIVCTGREPRNACAVGVHHQQPARMAVAEATGGEVCERELRAVRRPGGGRGGGASTYSRDAGATGVHDREHVHPPRVPRGGESDRRRRARFPGGPSILRW